MINEGDKAPALKATSSDGKHRRSRRSPGQPLVLYFYPKDDTSGCTREAQDFTAACRRFQEGGREGRRRVARPDEEAREVHRQI